ncbi:hypothetical protein GOL30_12660 [Sinorhizobium medicae]|uniref:hypothetical protein n=1 Tax=Sinorhizobium medicae TaxID=110321 RepID=UPI00040D564C|nr:hypothetical protein [Sinorhizobium medicae]MDX0429930.1 hypothetical protein [Sinorhizobium medicae]MDX0460608.1 hypothetical protein [Sinorhizobium medicae]MDX0533044.1 hypothetical protein [Sinorhizobium medicae]MDX0572654.1 hypothetical protein [Sinorhizobium medicae]MDX0600510.1 hypothetical protein [Sinorhizobium medicae]
MSTNEFGDDINVRFDDNGPKRGGVPTQPKRPETPSFASERTLLKAMKAKTVSEASLRASMYAHRVNNGELEGWKADYRRIMDKWRRAPKGEQP